MFKKVAVFEGVGRITQWIALLLRTRLPGFDSRYFQEFSLMLLKFIDIIAENSRQWLESVNQNHLVLASGKVVLQKRSAL